ncbi:MAG TPA: preprotein translocase subunit YajC [Actinophytocola sp.]|uniref:preprotein translocase subunit YajC n=1 Tax=Actinophytocola sp. TaxID=1872138 RepID=UPI002DBCAFD4|nr:preprotein translocase subunit YajC [Actinophytocola sp.]HEU5472857.1 preprotein translocase subunit YajC [Actinophytocola sp.]
MELLPLLLLFGMLGLMMYFMSRRQRRAMQQQQELQSSLNVGDRVMTTSGLYGTVIDVSDDSTIEIEIAPGVETTWLRAAIREKVVDSGIEEDLDDEEVLDEEEFVEEPVAEAEAKPTKQQS